VISSFEVNVGMLRKIGFIVYAIGKPLDPWLDDIHAVLVSP